MGGLLVGGVAVNRAAEVVARAVVGRLYGDETLGLYTALNAIIEVAAALAILGLQNAVLRVYGAVAGQPDAEPETTESGTLSGALVITLASSIVVSAGLAAAAAAGVVRVIVPSSIWFVSLAVAFLCWLRLSLALTQALRLFAAKVAIDDSLYPFVRVLLVVGLLSLGIGVTTTVPISTAVAAFLGIVVLLIWPRAGARLRRALRQPVRLQRMRALVLYGSPVAVAAFADFFVSQLDVIVLQAAMPLSQLGQYAAATTIGRSLLLLFTVGSYVYSPAFAASLDGRGIPTHPVYTRELGDFRFFSALLAIALGFLAPEALGLVFGLRFAQASTALVVIALGYLIVNLLGFNSYHLLLSGRSTAYAASRIAVVAAAVFFFAMLVPALGLLGAALGSTLTVVLAASSSALLSQHILRTPTTESSVLLYVLPMLAALLVVDQPLTPRLIGLGASVAFVLAVRQLAIRSRA